jgi:KDO2-lipid IV(A) lauroyltransferase
LCSQPFVPKVKVVLIPLMAKKTAPQIWTEYALTRGFVSAFGLLPRKASIALGKAFGRRTSRLFAKLSRVGLRNLELAFPEKSLAEREQLLERAFENLGRVLGTVAHFGELTTENFSDLIVYEPEPEFDAAYKRSIEEGRGRIIVGGHLGNWELQAFSYPIFFEPLTFLAREMDNPLIDKMVERIRTRLGNRQIDKTNSAAEIVRTLRRGGAIGMLADVNSHPREGVFVPFFGIPACTASGVAMLAIRTNALIVPSFAIWDETIAKYRVVHDQLIEPVNTGDRDSDIVATTALYTAAIERVIRKHPDQWIWVHRRWKTRPPGEPDLYAVPNES